MRSENFNNKIIPSCFIIGAELSVQVSLEAICIFDIKSLLMINFYYVKCPPKGSPVSAVVFRFVFSFEINTFSSCRISQLIAPSNSPGTRLFSIMCSPLPRELIVQRMTGVRAH